MPNDIPNGLNLPGLTPDIRSAIDISKDYIHAEVAPQAVVLNWNRDISGAPVYSVRNQDGSSSCVAQAGAKALETMTGVVQSAHPPYRRRADFPSLGMYLQNYGDLLRHLGTTTEVLDPSQNMSEAQMNADIMVETPLTETMYITADFTDMDVLATAIETQKHCILTIRSSYEEWDVDKPIVLSNVPTFGHAICATYYFTDELGQKCVLIDESWGLRHITKRVLTESFIKARATGAMYFLPNPPIPTPVKPHFVFSSTLSFGQSNLSIKNLQDALKYFGYFPNITSTGYFGSITAASLLKWQIANNVAPLAELQGLQGKSFGPKSIAKMNVLLA